MPMDFPDMQSLKTHAGMVKFRAPHEGETEEEFREALAKHVEPMDFLEAQEIRNKVGWDQFTDTQNRDVLMRALSRPRPGGTGG